MVLIYSTFTFVNTALKFMKYKLFSSTACSCRKSNKPDPKQQNIKKGFSHKHKGDSCLKNKSTSNPHNHVKNLALIF